MNAREEAITKLLNEAAELFNEPDIRKIRFDTTDRGNEDPNRRIYSMAYDIRKPELKQMCGPDWTFVHWPGANISSFRKEVEEINKAGNSIPELNKAGWSGNINSARPAVPEHKTRPLMKSMANESPDIMEVNHVYPPLPQKHKEYMSMADMVRKYSTLIDIGGNGYSGRIKYLLFSLRPLIMVDRFYIEYFHDDLKPWEHYIPVRMDLSDLVEKARWTLDNRGEANRMAERAFRFALDAFQEREVLNQVAKVWRKLCRS